MTEKKPTPPSLSSDEIHWGVAYLREDLQDLRVEIRLLHTRIDGTSAALGARMDERFDTQNARIDELGVRFDERFDTQNARIDEFNRSLNDKIDENTRSLLARMDERFEILARRLDSRFLWMMTTMVALSGIIVAVLK